MSDTPQTVDELLSQLQIKTWNNVQKFGSQKPNTPVAAYNLVDRAKALEQLHRLMLDVVGEDEGTSSNLIQNPAWEHRNNLRAELRPRIEEIFG